MGEDDLLLMLITAVALLGLVWVVLTSEPETEEQRQAREAVVDILSGITPMH